MSDLARRLLVLVSLLPLVAGCSPKQQAKSIAKRQQASQPVDAASKDDSVTAKANDVEQPTATPPAPLAETPPKETASEDPVTIPSLEVNPPEATAESETPTESKPPAQAVESEAAMQRYQQLLRRKPLHRLALDELVKRHSERGDLADLVQQYEQRVKALPDERSLQVVLARLYLRDNNVDAAVRIVERLAEAEQPGDREAADHLSFQSQVYQRAGRADEAISMLQKAFEQARTVSQQTKLAEGLADLHLRGDQRQQAAQVLTDFAAAYPDQFFHRKRLADALSQRGLHAAAVAEYRETLNLVDGQADRQCEVLRQLGASLEALDRSEPAIKAYTDGMDLLSAGHWMQREMHERVVRIYRSSGRTDELIQYCRDRLKQAPEQTVTRQFLADVLTASGQTDEALGVLNEAVRLFPRDRSLSAKRVALLERLQDDEGVAQEFERIIGQLPDEIDLYIQFGQFLARNANLQRARGQWKHVLDQEVADATLANRLGGLFEQFELHDDAVDCYERAITLDPKRSESYIALSGLWQTRGEQESAQQVLSRMAESNPTDAAVHARLSHALLGLSLREEALAAIARACELAQQQHRYQLAHSDLLLQTGKVDEALAVRRESLDLIPAGQQQTKAIDALVSMHASRGKLEALHSGEAERLKADETNAVSLLLLARAADTLRDYGSARRHLDQLLAADASHEEGLKALAELLETGGAYEEAIEQYRKLITLYPARNRNYFRAIVELKLRYNDRNGALETLSELATASADNSAVLRSVAEQLVRLQETETALSHLKQSVALQPENHQGRLQYARTLQNAGRLEEALEQLQRTALQAADRNAAADAVALLHDTAGQLGQLDSLMDDLSSRHEEHPDDTLTARVLAELYVREYEYARATGLMESVLRYQPGDVPLRLARAALNRRLTRFGEALDGYEQVLRDPRVDRDYVLGEIGKAHFEAGSVAAARRTWKRIVNKLYAGTLLRNNGLVEDAITVFQEGIRLTPDAFSLHRNLIDAFELAGREDDSLKAAERVLDLEPENSLNIKRVVEMHLRRGDHDKAAAVASRLFRSGLKTTTRGAAPYGYGYGGYGNMPASLSMIRMYSGYYGASQNPNDEAVSYLVEQGLTAELEEILANQLEKQPENGLLKLTAVQFYSDYFSKPEKSLSLLKDLEAAKLPEQYRSWRGQSSQQEHFRRQQLSLIVATPALRDRWLTEFAAKSVDQLSDGETTTLALIRTSQGSRDKAIELLQRVAMTDNYLALSLLCGMLMAEERFADAAPYAERLVALLEQRQQQMAGDLQLVVQRDFIRRLPLLMQNKIDNVLRAQIVDKWSRGNEIVSYWNDVSGQQVVSLHQARLNLAIIFDKTGEKERASELWSKLEPNHAADVDGWTTLSIFAQTLDESDRAFSYYERAIQGSKLLAADALLQRIFGNADPFAGSQDSEVDPAFNATVDAFAERAKLTDLYEFLRETNKTGQARRVAQQFDLLASLKQRYRADLEVARVGFQQSNGDPLEKSVPYFVAACKLAELHDWSGNWPEAKAIYEQYLQDFPDEIGLLQTLSEVAEARGEYDEALNWERQVVEAKRRLSRLGPAWNDRSLPVTPAIPQALMSGQDYERQQQWAARWTSSLYSWWGQPSPLDLSQSWMRIGQLYLANDNQLAAADAIQQSLQTAGTNRGALAARVLQIIRQRQLVKQMLPVLRTMFVLMPSEQDVQLALAESFRMNDRTEAATQVYQRILRGGVSDLTTLVEVKRSLQQLNPTDEADAGTSLAELEAEVEKDPANMGNLVRLAKACYYSLDIERAHELLQRARETAPHLEGLDDLLIQIYTVKDSREQLIVALREKIKKTKDDNMRFLTHQRLYQELIAAGQVDEALVELKKTASAQNSEAVPQIAQILQYLGRHDEAIEQYELRERSQRRGSSAAAEIAQVLAHRGDSAGAGARIVEAVSASPDPGGGFGMGFGGMMGGGDDENAFSVFLPMFVAYPDVQQGVREQLAAAYEKDPKDLAAARTLVQYYQAIGRHDLANAILEQPQGENLADPDSLAGMIARAVERQEFTKAIELAEKWLAQQPKQQLPPGVPAQFAAQLVYSERNIMICQIGDLHWKLGDKDKAMESYRRIVDERIEASKIAYALICCKHSRIAEARRVVHESLARQRVCPPGLLQFQGFLAVLEGDADEALVSYTAAFQARQSGTANQADMVTPGQAAADIQLLGRLARQAGKPEAYVTLLNAQLEANSNNWPLYVQLADFLQRDGKSDEAAAVIDRAAKVKTLQQQVLTYRLQKLEQLGDADELVPLYVQLIRLLEKQIKPDNNQSMFGYSRFASARDGNITTPYRQRLGELLWEQGKLAAAEQAWLAGQDLRLAATHLAMGQRYLQLEDYDRAEQSFQKAVDLDPDAVAEHQALAVLATQSDNRNAALKHLRVVFAKSNGQGGRYVQYNDPFGGWGSSYGRAQTGTLTELAIALRGSDDEAPKTEDANTRLMLASLSGDWSALDSELETALGEATLDPLWWRLWTSSKMRRQAWDEAIRGQAQLDRLAKTELADRADKLKLVLAGKQIKSAVAGTAGASPTPQNPNASMIARSSFQQSYYRGNSGYYAYQNQAVSVVDLHLKLKQFDKAEQALLRNDSQQFAQSTLPQLMRLMQQKGDAQRVAELAKFAVAIEHDGYSSTSPVNACIEPLIDAGHVDLAIDLLVRDYRLTSGPSQSDFFGSMTYGGSFQDQDLNRLQHVARIRMHIIRHDKYDAVVKTLMAEFQQDKADLRLGRLIADLRAMHGELDAARELVASMMQAHPKDFPLRAHLFRLQVQAKDWPAAIAIADEIVEQASAQAGIWRIRQATLQALSGNQDRARDILAEHGELADKHAKAWQALLLATGQYNRLAKLLANDRMRSDRQRGLLFGVHLHQQQWPAAANLAVTEFWQQLVTQQQNAWFDRLQTVVASAKQARAPVDSVGDRALDKALLTLVAADPQVGQAAFEQLVKDEPDNVDARRGLVFAAMHLGDDRRALAANRELLAWLKPRREHMWRAPIETSVQQQAMVFLKAWESNGIENSQLLSSSGDLSSLFQQAFSGNNGSRSAAAPAGTRYQSLWSLHRQLDRQLLLRTGQASEFVKLMRSRTVRLSYQRYNRDPFGPQNTLSSILQQSRANDWRRQVTRSLWSHWRLDEVAALYDELGSRLPVNSWLQMAEVCASLGRMDEANRWRKRWAKNQIATLLTTESPRLRDDPDDYNTDQDDSPSQRIVTILDAGHPTDEQTRDAYAEFRGRRQYRSLVGVAFGDPGIGAELNGLADHLGPGWEDSRSFDLVLEYLMRSGESQRLIELIERVLPGEKLALHRGNDQLAKYLQACYAVKDHERIRKVLDAFARQAPESQNHIAVHRLMLMRRDANDDAADRLERRLIDSCQTLASQWQPVSEVAGLMRSVGISQYNRYRGRSFQTGANNPAEILAAAAALQLDAIHPPPAMRLSTIRSAYSWHGFSEHAARLIDLESNAALLRDRAGLLIEKAELLHSAGRAGNAKSLLVEVEQDLLGRIATQPASAALRKTLSAVYASDSFGSDHEKALAAHRAARELDPSVDAFQLTEARHLYRLKRYEQAWRLYSEAIRKGGLGNRAQTDVLFQAGIAACRAGQLDTARPLLRLALWRSPDHEHAQQAKELIGDATRVN